MTRVVIFNLDAKSNNIILLRNMKKDIGATSVLIVSTS